MESPFEASVSDQTNGVTTRGAAMKCARCTTDIRQGFAVHVSNGVERLTLCPICAPPEAVNDELYIAYMCGDPVPTESEVGK